MSIDKVIFIIKKAGFNMLNIYLVYLFENVIIICFSDRLTYKLITLHSGSENFLDKNAFTIFSFCYQMGVFISRSSLTLVKVKRVGILTMLQLMNFSFWFINSIFLICDSLIILFLMMVLVGLMGGTIYVNVLY